MTPEAVQTAEAKRLKLRDAFRGLDVPNKDLDEAARFSLDPKRSKARMASQAWVHSNSAPVDEIPPSHLAQAFIGGAPATTATIQQPLEALVEVWDIERDRQSAIRFGTKGKVTDEQFYTSIAAQYNREDGVREDAVKTYRAAANAANMADFSEDEETGDIKYASWAPKYEAFEEERPWVVSYPGKETDKILRQVWKNSFESHSVTSLEAKKVGLALLSHLEVQEGLDPTDPTTQTDASVGTEIFDKLRLMPKEERQKVYTFLQANADAGKIKKDFYTGMGKALWGALGDRARDFGISAVRDKIKLVDGIKKFKGRLKLTAPLEDEDSPFDILRKVYSPGQGFEFPASLEPLPPEDVKRIEEAQKEAKTITDIELELRKLRRGVINPIKTDNVFLEKSWYPAVQQVGILALAASAVGQIPLLTFIREHRHQEMLERGMTEEQASKASSVSAIIETVIERFQMKTLVGGKYGLALKSVQGSILAKLGVVGGNLGAQITLQSAQEGLQDITPLIVQEYLGAALGEQFPEMQWLNKTNADGSVTKGELSKWGFQRIDTLWAMAPIIVFGAGVGSAKDFLNASDFLTTKDDLVAFGITEEVASEIAILAQTDVDAAGKAFQEAAKDIPAVKAFEEQSKQILEGRAKAAPNTKAFEERSKQVEELRRSPDRLRATKLEDGRIEVQLGDGVTTTVNTEAEYVQLEQQVVEGRAKAAREGMANLFEYFEKKGIAEFIKEDRSKTLGEGIEDGTLTTEEARQRIRDYNAESGNSYSENAFSRFTIAAQNEAEFRDGVFHNVVRVLNGIGPFALVEDVSEGLFKKRIALEPGARLKHEGWLDQYQNATGDILVPDIKAATNKSLGEAFSSLATSYFAGKVQESSLPNGIKSLFRQLAVYFQHVFSRAAKLDKAFKDGKLDPEFETYLAESVGLSLDGREALAIQKAAVKEQKQVLKDLKSSMDETNKTNLNGLMDGLADPGTTMSIQPANEDVRLGYVRSDVPASESSARVSHTWGAIGLSEEGFSFKKSLSASAHDIAAAVSTKGNTVVAARENFSDADKSAEELRARRAQNIANETDWAREQRLEWEKDNPGREFIFSDNEDFRPVANANPFAPDPNSTLPHNRPSRNNEMSFSVKETGARISLYLGVEKGVTISAMSASPNGKQLYTAVFDFLHNNGLVDTNPDDLTAINVVRKVSNMFASALRWGSVRHLSTNRQMGLDFVEKTDANFRENLARLAKAEANNVFHEAPELRRAGLDFKSGVIVDEDGNAATEADVKKLVLDARSATGRRRSPLGAATIVRALITEAAIKNDVPNADLMNLPRALAKSDSLPTTFSISPLPEFEGATEISLRDEGFGFRNETDAKYKSDTTSLIRDNKEVTGPTSINLLDIPQEGEGRGPEEVPAHMASMSVIQEKNQVSDLLGVPYKDLEDTPVRRIMKISVPNDYKGAGVGQALRLAHYQEADEGEAYFYNSQQSPEAARSTRALVAKGLIELHDDPRPGQAGLGANVTFLTEKGRETEPLSLIYTRTAAEANKTNLNGLMDGSLGTTMSIQPANEDVRLGWHRSKEPKSAVDARISYAWAAIGLSEEGFSFEKTPSKSAHDIAASVSTPGNTVIADADSFANETDWARARRARRAQNIANETDWAREERLEWEKSNPGREFIFADEGEKSPSLNQVGFSVKETGASIELFSTRDGKVNIFASDASPNGKQLYTAANDFIHNNGLVDMNPQGLTKINRLRKVSNMFVSAVRWGTVRHLSTNAEMNVTFDSPLDDGFFRTNLAKLARAEAEIVSRLAPELRDIGLDFKSGAIINKEGVEATAADVENIVSIARTIRIGGRSPLGAATIVRSLITQAAANANVIPDSDLVNLPARLAKSDSLPTTFSITPDLLEDVLDQHFNPPEARMDVVESIFDRLSKVQDRFIKIKRNAGTNKTLVTRAETQEVLAQLEAIVAALPLPIRGKIQGFATLASKPTDRGRLTYLEGRIELSMKVLDKFLADESRKKFDKLLKRSQPRSANGKLKGYLTPEVAADLEDIQKLSAMTTEDLDAWSTGMQERVAKTGDAETATAKLWLAERFGALKGMNAFEADAALTDLREMVAEGRNKHRLAEEAFKNQIADKLSQAFDDSVEDLNPNPDPEDVDRAKKAEKEGFLRVVRGIKGFLVDHLSFRQSLITVFGYSQTTDRMEKLANDAKNEYIDSTLARKQAMDDWMRVALNLPNIKQRFQWLTDLKEQKETGIVNTNNRKMKMSQDEAIYYTMLWDQPNYRSNLETHDGIDRRTIEKIEEWLTPESRQYRSWLQEEYDKEYDRINAVYRIINGVDLPKVAFYSPASTKLPGSKDLQLDPLGQDHLSTGLAAGFTKLRTAHNLPMRRIGASTMYWAHAQATDFYVSHALAARELRLIITNPKMMDAIVEKHGVHRAQVLEGYVTGIHNDGLKHASLVLSAERWTNRLVRTTSLVGLSWNTLTMAKQVSAANAALAEVPVKDYAIGMNRILTDPEYYAYIWNSKTIQRRIANGFSPEMQQAYKLLEYRPDTLAMVMNEGVVAIGKVDAAFTTISAGIAYDYHYKLAKKANLSDAQAEAIALDKMDLVVARTAQPTALVDRSLMELNMDANIIGRLFILFRSEMRQKAAITMMGVRDVIRNDGHALAGARAATSMWIVMSIVTALMEQVYKTLMRDDEDEDLFDPKHLLHVMTAGQSAGIFFFGDAMEVASKRVWGQEIWSNDTNSVVSAVKQAFDALDKVTEGEFHEDLVANTNKVARAVSMVVGGRGAALGVGARVVNEAVRAVENISNGIEFFPTPSPTESALAKLLAEQEEQDRMADEVEEILEEAKPQSLKDEEESIKEFKEEHKDLMKLRVGTLKKPGARARGVRAVLDAAPEEDRESLRQALIDAKIISKTVEKQLKKLKKLP